MDAPQLNRWKRSPAAGITRQGFFLISDAWLKKNNTYFCVCVYSVIPFARWYLSQWAVKFKAPVSCTATTAWNQTGLWPC